MTFEIPEWVMTWDFWNMCIALIALFTAFYSVWYTRKNDRFNLQISNARYYQDDDKPYFLLFDVFNNSNKGITIERLEIFTVDNQPAALLPTFDPNVFYNEKSTSRMDYRTVHPSEYQEPFLRSEIIPANSTRTFSYYINPMNTPLKIKITTDKPIRYFMKHKSFLVHFMKSD